MMSGFSEFVHCMDAQYARMSSQALQNSSTISPGKTVGFLRMNKDKSLFGDTIFLGQLLEESTPQSLTRIHFTKKNGSSVNAYDERWLQNLIMNHPGLLPVRLFEPAFENMVPICVELPLKAGFVDNLLITPRGDLVIVECKLWRNPEARREVIAQIIDYASEMSGWSYEDLQKAIDKTHPLNSQNGKVSRKLTEIVSATSDEFDEIAFHDIVSRNLKQARFLLMVVGDGIQEGIEVMAEFLQQHAGLHFTLALVELALFKLPTDGYIVQPRVLARTTNIERGIVTLKDGRVEIAAPEIAPNRTMQGTLTEERFFEDLEKNLPGTAETLKHFLDELTQLNITPEFGTDTLILRWHAPNAKSWNLGTITRKGELWMDYLGQQAKSANVLELSKQFVENLAMLVPNAYVKKPAKETAWNIAAEGGRNITVNALLSDALRRKGWVHAIEQFQQDLEKGIQEP